MVGDIHESSNWRRYMNYCREIEAIGRKLSNQEVPDEKRRRLRVRLEDIQNRLIPALVAGFQVIG